MGDFLRQAYVEHQAQRRSAEHDAIVESFLISGAMPHDIRLEIGPLNSWISGVIIHTKQEARIV